MSLSSFIWSVADLLRGDYKQSEYGKVILPFTVLRRMDCVLERIKETHSPKTKPGKEPESSQSQSSSRVLRLIKEGIDD